MLLNEGASVKAKDVSGRTALQYACNEATASFLEAALSRIVIYREIYEINMQVRVALDISIIISTSYYVCGENITNSSVKV